MREIENYELILSGEGDERILLTFDWDDVPKLPKSAKSVVVNEKQSTIHVVFEDGEHWEEVMFINLPKNLYDIIKNHDEISVVGLTDEVEMFSNVKLEFA